MKKFQKTSHGEHGEHGGRERKRERNWRRISHKGTEAQRTRRKNKGRGRMTAAPQGRRYSRVGQ